MNRIVRPMTETEIPIALEWAAAEGWNPGLEDAPAFAVTDPQAFWLCCVDGEPVACISVVRYDEKFGFLGFYITKPEYRGLGHGWATWEAGMAHLGARTIGLDGVVAQQANYARSGFAFAHRNVRYGGVPREPDGPDWPTVDLHGEPLADILAFDRHHFPAPRPLFWDFWRSGQTRAACGVHRDGALVGVGVIRTCHQGSKLGPVFAENEGTARALIRDLLRHHKADEQIFIDPPEPNTAAIRIAQEMGLSPVFETARMYRGQAPSLPLRQIFGITTFELG